MRIIVALEGGNYGCGFWGVWLVVVHGQVTFYVFPFKPPSPSHPSPRLLQRTKQVLPHDATSRAIYRACPTRAIPAYPMLSRAYYIMAPPSKLTANPFQTHPPNPYKEKAFLCPPSNPIPSRCRCVGCRRWKLCVQGLTPLRQRAGHADPVSGDYPEVGQSTARLLRVILTL